MDQLVREMFLTGVSTRKVREVVEPLVGEGLSAQTVSRICRSLDGAVRRQTEPMSCFQNAASVDRIVYYGVVSHLNEAWQEKPLPQFTHNA